MPLWGECGLTRGKTLQRKKAHGRKNLTMQSIQMGFSVLLSTKHLQDAYLLNEYDQK